VCLEAVASGYNNSISTGQTSEAERPAGEVFEGEVFEGERS
jgi:hypothetical protein